MELNPQKITYVSPTFERIFGIPAKELYQDPQCWMNAVHQDDRRMLGKLFENWIAGTEQTFDTVYRIVDQEGNIKYLRDQGLYCANLMAKSTRRVESPTISQNSNSMR